MESRVTWSCRSVACNLIQKETPAEVFSGKFLGSFSEYGKYIFRDWFTFIHWFFTYWDRHIFFSKFFMKILQPFMHRIKWDFFKIIDISKFYIAMLWVINQIFISFVCLSILSALSILSLLLLVLLFKTTPNG